MMYIAVNYLAVIIAAIVNMVVGFLWFGPIFGKQWIAMMGWTAQQMDSAKKQSMTKSYIFALIGSLLSAFVLAELTVVLASYLNLTGVMAGLKAGFLGWVGFAMPVLLGTVLWENRTWKLWGLNVAYYLVAYVVMGLIVGYWM